MSRFGHVRRIIRRRRDGGPALDPSKAREDRVLSRRRFMARLTGAMMGGIAAALGVPGAWFVVGASQQRTADSWIALGPTTAFPPGAPTQVTTTVARQVGWETQQQEVTVFVSTSDGAEFLGLSDRCTHLGCRVRFVAEEDSDGRGAGYICPCHDGVFAPDGSVVSGPLPRPLDRFEMKVEQGQVYARKA